MVCLCLSRSTTTKRPNGTAELQIIDAWDRVQAALDRVAAVRDAVPALGIAVDFHGRVHKPMAKVLLKELEPYRLMFNRGTGAVRAPRLFPGRHDQYRDTDRAR
ncbi:MAG TPA: enolase C-terminal domain-like protein [Propionibacteriaceae bacterium]